MKKKIIILTGLFILFALTMSVYAVNKPTTPTINFNNKVYQLKWSNANSAGGYTNEYLTNNETFDTYHTMVTIQEYPKIQDFKASASNMYNNFIAKVNKGEAVLAALEPINQTSSLVRFCAATPVPKPNLECSYINVQKRADDNSVVVFLYTQRYFTSEVTITEKNFQQIINNDYVKIKPYITTVKAPKAVRQQISAPASYYYGTKTTK